MPGNNKTVNEPTKPKDGPSKDANPPSKPPKPSVAKPMQIKSAPKGGEKPKGKPAMRSKAEQDEEIVDQIFNYLNNGDGAKVTIQLVGQISDQEIKDFAIKKISTSGVPTAAEVTMLKRLLNRRDEQYKEISELFEKNKKEMEGALDTLAEQCVYLTMKQEDSEQVIEGGSHIKGPNFVQGIVQGCRYCEALNHSATACPVYPTAEARILLLKTKKCCLTCSQPGHDQSVCTNNERVPICRKCNIKHFYGTCILRHGATALKEREEAKKKREEKKMEEKEKEEAEKNEKEIRRHPHKKSSSEQERKDIEDESDS